MHRNLASNTDAALKPLSGSGGMSGLSLHPHHLKRKAGYTLEGLRAMVARTAKSTAVECLALDFDLSQDRSDSVVEWIGVSRYAAGVGYCEGSSAVPGFPPMPSWFQDTCDFRSIEAGLHRMGSSLHDIGLVMGENRLRFFDENFDKANT